MSKKNYITCESCHGKLKHPKRGGDLDKAIEVHQATCPGRGIKKKS